MTLTEEQLKSERTKVRRHVKADLKKSPEVWKVLLSLLGNSRKNLNAEEFMDLGVAISFFGQYWIDEAKARNHTAMQARLRSQYKRDLAKSVREESKISKATKNRFLEGELNLL